MQLKNSMSFVSVNRKRKRVIHVTIRSRSSTPATGIKSRQSDHSFTAVILKLLMKLFFFLFSHNCSLRKNQ